MKKSAALLSMAVVLAAALTSCAQDSKPSPPAKATGKLGNANISIDYSAPSVRGRKIFGDLVPYGKVWRAGANNATVFETDADIKVEGQPLPKGKYAIFMIPAEIGNQSMPDWQWTIVFSKNASQWGSFRYKQEEDALRVKVAPSKSSQLTEKLVYEIGGGKVTMKWENAVVSFKVE